ncbi:hypothetical protein J2741_000615 [Methanolinea mesophila]|nr:hypothetical protein [Methanolinea mesophila]
MSVFSRLARDRSNLSHMTLQGLCPTAAAPQRDMPGLSQAQNLFLFEIKRLQHRVVFCQECRAGGCHSGGGEAPKNVT